MKMPEPVAWMDRDGDVYKELPTPYWHPPHQALFTEAHMREALASHEAVMRMALKCLKNSNAVSFDDLHAIKALEDALK